MEYVDRAILENAHFLLKIVEDPGMFGHDIDLEGYTSEGKGEQKAQVGPTHTHDHDRSSGEYFVASLFIWWGGNNFLKEREF